jgi:hypothetical protein
MGDSIVSIIIPVLKRVDDDGCLPRIDSKADVSTDRAHRGGWRIYEWELDLLREYRAPYPLPLGKRARKRHVRSQR